MVVVALLVVVVVVCGALATVVVGDCWPRDNPLPPRTGIRRRPVPEAATAALMGSAGEKGAGEELAAAGCVKKLALVRSGDRLLVAGETVWSVRLPAVVSMGAEVVVVNDDRDDVPKLAPVDVLGAVEVEAGVAAEVVVLAVVVAVAAVVGEPDLSSAASASLAD